MPFCRKCGHEVDSDDQFCYECGAPVGPTVGQADKRGKVKAPKKPTPQEITPEPLATKQEVVSTPGKPPIKPQRETGKRRIGWPVMKPQPIVPTQTVAAEEIPTEAPKKAGKLRIRWPIILGAAVAVVALGVATWWFAFSSPGELVFKDDFSNTDNGWLVESGDWGGIAYSNGELAIHRKTALWAFSTNDNVGEQTDFIVEVDARKIPEGEDNTDCSILFRFQDNKNFYGFYVAPRGNYSVWKKVGGEWTKLIDWTESDYIKTGTSTNKLKVVCQGQKMDFYINGHKVDTTNDDTFIEGKIAISVTSVESTPAIEYHFDNFKLYKIGLATIDNYPNVTSFSVPSTSIKQGETLTFSYSVSDDIGLKQVELWREDSTAGVSFRPIKTTSVSGKSYTGSFSDAPSAPGAYWYGLHAVDTNNEWNCERNSRTGFSPGVYGPIHVVVEASE
ncbi:MAG: zinc ribbon domain-containing protein [Chloroflexi bacterium]|nr:zinc ribbon domain-containing protein [Chloroflexota bacterium]